MDTYGSDSACLCTGEAHLDASGLQDMTVEKILPIPSNPLSHQLLTRGYHGSNLIMANNPARAESGVQGFSLGETSVLNNSRPLHPSRRAS